MATDAPKAPGVLLGLGLGGFVDGILLHQILQWHHMLSGERGGEPLGTVAGLEANTLADGFFHVATWFLVAGWGIFNLVGGLVEHQLLGIHHVRDDRGGPLGWDLGFLALGAALVVGGFALARPRGG
jgi:uncharacterized membrane protein